MAHQIRNPVAIIKANASVILERENLSPESRRSMESILNGVQYLGERLDELVEFSKPLALKFNPVDLSKLITETLAIVKDSCKLKRIQISSNLGEVMLKHADKNQLFIALTNLLLNAIEAIPDGGGKLSVKANIEGGEACVMVEDNGSGIHPRDLLEAFTPFYSTKPNSIGIGLSVAKRIVEAHGGKIGLKSVKDQGTQAWVSLPILQA